jgi:hypothetical protein
MLKKKAQTNKTSAREEKTLVLFYCNGLDRVPPHRMKMSLPFDLSSPYHFIEVV